MHMATKQGATLAIGELESLKPYFRHDPAVVYLPLDTCPCCHGEGWVYANPDVTKSNKKGGK